MLALKEEKFVQMFLILFGIFFISTEFFTQHSGVQCAPIFNSITACTEVLRDHSNTVEMDTVKQGWRSIMIPGNFVGVIRAASRIDLIVPY